MRFRHTRPPGYVVATKVVSTRWDPSHPSGRINPEVGMATQEGGQSRPSKQREDVEEVADETSSDVAERHEKLTDDVDAILDDIDEVLETNPEDFVRSFVQKGGQ
jgi:prokaryotic ubiquitin-like protein Pup